MIHSVEQQLALDRAGREVAPEAFFYPLHPELGGVLPWATTAGRPALYWLTGDDPDEWPVVVAEWGTEFATYDLSATSFLRAWTLAPLSRRSRAVDLTAYFRQPSVPLDDSPVILVGTSSGRGAWVEVGDLDG